MTDRDSEFFMDNGEDEEIDPNRHQEIPRCLHLLRSSSPEAGGWKFDDGDFSVADTNLSESRRRGYRKVGNGGEVSVSVSVSARKLGARLWKLQVPVVPEAKVKTEVGQSSTWIFVCRRPKAGYTRLAQTEAMKWFAWFFPSTDTKIHPSGSLPLKLGIQEASKSVVLDIFSFCKGGGKQQSGTLGFENGCLKTLDKIYQFNGHMKLLKDLQTH
ncbi:hypothetical protein HHK36_005635 [Tetracentron sinense]|uniref:Uncharacterized protein n=1 Tax=Tetracentron sinense TaxID=13715 RepID=A0A834ZNN5_TETSI|nr:hypothetical protein HHK36_005635 [Tetracentron sinense]